MIKKSLFVGTAIVLLLGLLLGGSHLRTVYNMAKDTVADNVPIQYELKRARQMIKDLDPEIRRNMELIAKQEVTVKQLSDQVDRVREQLVKSKGNIERLTEDLQRGPKSNFVYAGRSYSATQVREDLTRRFDRFKTQEATAEKLEKILHARLTALDAAREKLKEMHGAKRQLEVEVANLEARLELVQVAQTASEVNVDDSHLSRTRELVQSISTRIDVAEKLVNADTDVLDEIPLEDKERTDIVEEVTRHFAASPGAHSIVLE
jgi:phage shock protein A